MLRRVLLVGPALSFAMLFACSDEGRPGVAPYPTAEPTDAQDSGVHAAPPVVRVVPTDPAQHEGGDAAASNGKPEAPVASTGQAEDAGVPVTAPPRQFPPEQRMVLMVSSSVTTAVSSSRPLTAGRRYSIEAGGTYSAWAAAFWTGGVCVGTPDRAPMYSDGPTGPVGSDAEYMFAWPSGSPSLCPNGTPVAPAPMHARNVQLDLDGQGFGALPAAEEQGLVANHVYHYLVVGTGVPAQFQHADMSPMDNYGLFQILITPL